MSEILARLSLVTSPYSAAIVYNPISPVYYREGIEPKPTPLPVEPKDTINLSAEAQKKMDSSKSGN